MNAYDLSLLLCALTLRAMRINLLDIIPYFVFLQVTKLAFNGEVRQQQPRMNRIYFAIFAMVCCFWPLGLVALLKAIKVSP